MDKIATTTEFNVKVYANKVEYDSEGNIFNENTYEIENYQLFSYSGDKDVELTLNNNSTTRVYHSITLQHQDEEYSGEYYFKGEVLENIGHLNKGSF